MSSKIDEGECVDTNSIRTGNKKTTYAESKMMGGGGLNTFTATNVNI